MVTLGGEFINRRVIEEVSPLLGQFVAALLNARPDRLPARLFGDPLRIRDIRIAGIRCVDHLAVFVALSDVLLVHQPFGLGIAL
ncbi:hypothetical protein D3C87_1365180 [compost metagenome]